MNPDWPSKPFFEVAQNLGLTKLAKQPKPKLDECLKLSEKLRKVTSLRAELAD